MEFSYRFYTNKDCIYLPCHDVTKVDEFNCLFCFCPLYFVEDCGGEFIMSSGIKDCSHCLIPHRPAGYDYITQKIGNINNERVDIFLENLQIKERKDNEET